MKIEDARVRYNVQIKTYYSKQKELYAQKQKLEEKIKTTENGAEVYKDESAILELQYSAVDEKRQEYQDYMDKLMEQWRMISDKIASKQQSDAMADQAKEMNKIMLVARRIMHGDKVPAKDEKKLMEYDPKLYMMAKNAAAMLEMRKRKEHKSLWEDEEEKEQSMGSFAAQAKEIASNPYIPKDKKVVLMQRLNNEVCMIRDAHQAFEKSRAYEELPEEQELRREAAEESAEKMEHQKDTEQAETTEDSKVDNKNKADAEAEEVDEPQSDVKSEMSDVYETVEIANVETHAKIKPPESPKTAGDASMARRQQEAAQTFTEITEEIERFLRRNHSGRGSFTAQV